MRMETKGLLLDVGNVIATFNHEKSCEWISRHTRLTTEAVRSILFETGGPCEQHDLGLPSEEFYRMVCRLTGLRASMADFFDAWSDIFTENPAIFEILKRVRPSTRIGVVTNTDRIHWKSIEQLRVMRTFFPNNLNVATSFMVKAKKPAREIYNTALSMIDCSANETLYIDDVATYAQAFRQRGGNAEVYDCSSQPPMRLERILKFHNLLT